MTFDQAMVVHMGLGTVGLGLFWAGLGARKGGPRHRVSGRAFFVVLLGVAVFAGAMATKPWTVLALVDLSYLAVLGWGAWVERRKLA